MPSRGTSLVVQWLGLCSLTAENLGLIPSWKLKSLKPCSVAKKKKSPQGKPHIIWSYLLLKQKNGLLSCSIVCIFLSKHEELFKNYFPLFCFFELYKIIMVLRE